MIKVYKIGGNIINDLESLKQFLSEFASVPGKKILVHGGGKEASELGKKIGLEVKMIDGRRVTDKETLDLVVMVYAGLINKRIVSMLQEFNCNAVGLSGADGNVIPAKKRNPEPVDFGFVGDIDPCQINTGFISLLLNANITPVFCAICRNSEGGLLNCNADSIANALAVACAKFEETSLTYLFEKPGFLANINDEKSVIKLITPDIFDSLLLNGQISGGMIPKVSNAVKAIENGVSEVKICGAKDITGLEGTIIKR